MVFRTEKEGFGRGLDPKNPLFMRIHDIINFGKSSKVIKKTISFQPLKAVFRMVFFLIDYLLFSIKAIITIRFPQFIHFQIMLFNKALYSMNFYIT